MINTLRLTENLGRMQDAHFFKNCMGIRITRTHLLARGVHIDVSTLAEQAGFQIRVFFRREAFDRLTENPSQFKDEEIDLYNAVLSMRQAMMKAPLRDCPVLFQVGDVTLVAHLGNIDHDDPRRAITVALASNNEDEV